MAYGYSNVMAKKIMEKHKADPSDPVFELLSIYVGKNLPPSHLADALGVSKQTVYDWIAQRYAPKPDKIDAIKKLIKVHRKSKKG